MIQQTDPYRSYGRNAFHRKSGKMAQNGPLSGTRFYSVLGLVQTKPRRIWEKIPEHLPHLPPSPNKKTEQHLRSKKTSVGFVSPTPFASTGWTRFASRVQPVDPALIGPGALLTPVGRTLTSSLPTTTSTGLQPSTGLFLPSLLV